MSIYNKGTDIIMHDLIYIDHIYNKTQAESISLT